MNSKGATQASCRLSTVAQVSLLTLPPLLVRQRLVKAVAPRARCRFTEIPRPKDLKMGDESGIPNLDFQLRAAPGEVTFIDHGGSASDAQAAKFFMYKWAIGLARQADWEFEICSESPEEDLCHSQRFCNSAYEVPWLFEHFRPFRSFGSAEGRKTGVLILDQALLTSKVQELLASARQSGKHLWITRGSEPQQDSKLSELQNVCDNNVLVWSDEDQTKVKVCSVRNGSTSQGLTRSFQIDLSAQTA